MTISRPACMYTLTLHDLWWYGIMGHDHLHLNMTCHDDDITMFYF